MAQSKEAKCKDSGAVDMGCNIVLLFKGESTMGWQLQELGG